MTQTFSRRGFVAAALCGLAGPGLAAAPTTSLRPQPRPFGSGAAAPAAQVLIDKARLGGPVSYAVIDVKTGTLLEGRAPAMGLPPASVNKTVTSLYALDALGAEHRFATRLIATGPLRNGVLQGDLVLAGGGDPTLDTDALADMAAQLKQAGLRELRGQFRVWGGALPFKKMIDAGQPQHVGYNPSLSGLNLNYNRVHFGWKRSGKGYTVTMDARSGRYRPEVGMARMIVADRRGPVYEYADRGGVDHWSVARGALGNGGARWLPVRKPELYAGEVLAGFARAHGIVLGAPRMQPGVPSGTALVTHYSSDLRGILRGMLRYSTNLTAELVGMSATAAHSGRPASLSASARAMSGWAQDRLGLDDARLVDHSGLSEASRLTTGGMARVLAHAGRAGDLKPILRDFPLRDSNGAVRRDHPVTVQAKTGTLYFVSALAGYATARDGTDLAFAIFTANPDRRAVIDTARDERPAGARGWNRRSRRLQQDLIERWVALHNE